MVETTWRKNTKAANEAASDKYEHAAIVIVQFIDRLAIYDAPDS